MEQVKLKILLGLVILFGFIFCDLVVAQEEISDVKYEGDYVIVKKETWDKIGDCYIFLYERRNELEKKVIELEGIINSLNIRIKELEAENNNLKNANRNTNQKSNR